MPDRSPYLTKGFFGDVDRCLSLHRVGLCLEKLLKLFFPGKGFVILLTEFTLDAFALVELEEIEQVSEESTLRGSIGEYFSFVVNFGLSDNGALY